MTTTLTARQTDVLEGIRAGKMLKEISGDLDLSRQRISQLVEELKELGLVIGPRRARYQTTDEPHTYRKLPVTIEAVRFTGTPSADRILMWASSEKITANIDADGECTTLLVRATKGPRVIANHGDWVVQTTPDNFEILEDPEFTELYEAVSDDI